MTKQRENTFGQVMLRLGFVIYVAAMIWLLFGQRWGEEVYKSVNLRPFVTLRLYWKLLHGDSAYYVRHAFINLAGNVVMFIPLGFFQPYLMKFLRKWYKTLLSTTVLILTIECIQYLTGLGSCDIDDVILNVAGAIIGYILWRANRRK